MADDGLEGAEKRDLAIQTGLQLIPYVGGSLCTLYFGTKQEKRFKRIESFYAELAEELKQVKGAIPPVEKQDAPALEAIMESLHDKVEAEPTAEKRQFFLNYLKHTLLQPVSGNFDERKYFLTALDEMSLLECELLAFINGSAQVQVGSIQKPGTEQYAMVGAIGRLKARGFLTASQGSFAIGGGADNSLQEIVQVSSFGKRFHSFCLDA
ncbi:MULTISPECIES: hypothetical protein [Xanthomonas]|uniref:hypothetical protein n=1 Tax=Xanthomonas TaxID=338 RepID=UPI00096CA5AE|nr:hypothetical protein [Xanthomonas campestris]MCC5092682.1 hypothetical protein [Xanthomonas campestris pv. incanae]MEA0762809.1 hypothetical protein [Xanthomonas campestris pv. campestris]MEA9610331.1 hypothetical protein [Xanthomonas campestris pv. incanae]MEA9621509.1 hypothetical protein [Xanthomonas campestris pv. incanae]MEB1224627.1 hypothetical protein [Xanthomonas campestris pv. campestris]